VARIDLNEMRLAEAEAGREEVEVILGDPPQTFMLPHYLDWDAEAAQLLAADDVFGAFELILGEAEYRRFRATKPRIGDMINLVTRIEELAMGEAAASARSNGSSPTTGRRSRPTSSASTASTSRRRGGRAGPAARAPGGSTG
jgi:hypothetical protein